MQQMLTRSVLSPAPWRDRAYRELPVYALLPRTLRALAAGSAGCAERRCIPAGGILHRAGACVPKSGEREDHNRDNGEGAVLHHDSPGAV